jgi:hypothetical protein
MAAVGATNVATVSVTVEPPAPLETSVVPRGDWVGEFGADRYVLAGWDGTSSGGDLVALPDGVTLTVEQASRWQWSTDTSNPRALMAPDSSHRRATTWYGSQVRVLLEFDDA